MGRVGQVLDGQRRDQRTRSGSEPGGERVGYRAAPPASLVALTVPFRVVMAFSLVAGNAAFTAAGQTTATAEQTDLSIPPGLRSAPGGTAGMAGKFGYSSLLP